MNGGTFHSFSEAVNIVLAPADYDRFIDPAVTGDDRRKAIELMKMMPANRRGDFVLVEGDRVTSNRPELALKVRKKTPQEISAHPLPHPAVVTSGRRSTMSYPPTGGSGGPYIRTYGKQGAMAGLTYATIPCFSQLRGSDHGFMYFNAYSASSTGSIVDAGLEIYNDYKVHAFINSRDNPNGLFTGWTNEVGHDYYCTQVSASRKPLGILFGFAPNGQMVLIVGEPDYNPYVYNLPPAQSTWHNATWNFSSAPFGLSAVGTWQGITSPCVTCSIARMFTISPGTPGSCFGACNGALTGRWDQTVMGELVLPCSNAQAECTIRYPTDVSQWYGGENDSGNGIVLSGYDFDHGLEGIDLSRGGRTVTSIPDGTFNSPLRDIVNGQCGPEMNGSCGNYYSITNANCDPSDSSSPTYASNWIWRGYDDASGVIRDFWGSATTVDCFNFQIWYGGYGQDPQTYYNNPLLPGPYDLPHI